MPHFFRSLKPCARWKGGSKTEKEFSYLTEHKSLVLFPMSGRTQSTGGEEEEDDVEEYKGKRPSSKHEQHTNCKNRGRARGKHQMENEN